MSAATAKNIRDHEVSLHDESLTDLTVLGAKSTSMATSVPLRRRQGRRLEASGQGEMRTSCKVAVPKSAEKRVMSSRFARLTNKKIPPRVHGIVATFSQ